ncbi:helix-turn-helix domain-containing protein [Kitasatospora sp. NPDC008050]|uniref:helix-turn-helix domain-containing protein n=1 Tax=Kitasatospora sp. NPDC008050 TaxID=3364021 RepID=UPI0036E8D300
MAQPKSHVQQRRRIGRILRELREASGLTIEQAGSAIGRSDSTISRIENGLRDAHKLELAGLLDTYGAPDETRVMLTALAREAPDGGVWTAHEATFPPDLETYLGLEQAARSLRVFALSIVHSLLRTADTMHAIIRAGLPTAGEGEIAKLVAAHLARQDVLQRRPDPLDLQVVLDEASLRRPAGGAEVTRGQIDQLIHFAEEVPNVTLHVLPFAKGSHGSLAGGFTLIDFPDPHEPEVVYCDTPGGNLYLQKPHDTRRFSQLYGRLLGVALDPADTGRFLRTVRQEM